MYNTTEVEIMKVNRTFFTEADEKQLFDFVLNRSGSLSEIKHIEDKSDLVVCLFNCYTAEVAIWTFFQEKLLQVRNLEQFWELVGRVRRIFGKRHLSIKSGISALNELLAAFSSFVTMQCIQTRNKLHAISE